ncbi:terminase [Marinilactibacillus sp. 15R]|uniref:phage terminase small subunit P27 family n=1 Tax=Marinilactibacillus sp. 15R TaxID=1911586 RepID=UPI000909D515|nr:phage terminase small subunit P27 family [Marinilactibacillus sp. 15R]API89424.1 terminase [Marinilactibacillus sp. 15R]
MPQPAKSASLQLLHGNPNKKNTDELKKRAKAEEKMKMATDKIKPPSWLDALGKKTFAFIQEELLTVELISNPDIHSMALYCSWYSQYVLLTKQYKKMQSEHKKEYKQQKENYEITGEPIELSPEMYGNPLSKQMDTCSKNIRAYGSDLGLSPSARAKLAIKMAEDEDDDDDF